MKKLLSLILVASMVVALLASCSGAASSAPASSDAPAADVPMKEVVLTWPNIWVGADSKAAIVGKMIEDFNAANAGKYKVVVEEQTDYDAYRDKIRTIIATGNAPDFFIVDNAADLAMFAESGKLLDFSELVADSAFTSRFAEGALVPGVVGGTQFAIPYEMAVVPMLYNQKLLDSAGVTAIPKSYDDLWAAGDKLKAAKIFPTVQMTGGNAWFSMLWYSYALASVGGKDVYTKGLDDPAFEKAAEIVKKMYDYTHSDAVGAIASVGNGYFFNEKLAIYTNGTWILGRIKSEGVEGLVDNVKVSGSLSADGKNGGAILTSVLANLVASNNPEKKEAVFEFIKFITDEARVTELTNSSGALFSVKLDSTKVENPLLSEVIKAKDSAAFSVQYFSNAMPTAQTNALPAAFDALVLGDVDAKGFVEILKKAE